MLACSTGCQSRVAVKEAASLRKHASCSSALCFGVISGETGAATGDMLPFPTITCHAAHGSSMRP